MVLLKRVRENLMADLSLQKPATEKVQAQDSYHGLYSRSIKLLHLNMMFLVFEFKNQLKRTCMS